MPGRKTLTAHSAVYLAFAVGVAAFALSLFLLPTYAVAVGVNAMFLTYLGFVVWEFPAFTPRYLRHRAADTDAPVLVIFAVMVTVVLVATIFLFLALNDPGGANPYAVAASAVSVLLGWFTIHTLTAFHYAHEYYAPGEGAGEIRGGLGFPSEGEPDGWAFLYFSYVIGMTAQVADVPVTSNRMRRLVVMHGVFSFFFNTLILAATVNTVVALAGK